MIVLGYIGVFIAGVIVGTLCAMWMATKVIPETVIEVISQISKAIK